MTFRQMYAIIYYKEHKVDVDSQTHGVQRIPRETLRNHLVNP